MEQEFIFKKCRHFNYPYCPGQNPVDMRAVKSIIIDYNGENVHSIDGLDFIRQYGKMCSECKKYKASNPNIH